MPSSIEVSKKTSMKMFHTALGTTVLAIAITIPFTVPAGAANAVVSSFAKQLVVAAAHAKPAHYVTNIDLNKAAPSNGQQAVAVIFAFRAFANPRIAGFITTEGTSAQCELFPARVGAAPSIVACPATGRATANWAPRLKAAAIATRIDAEAYQLSTAPTLATLNAAALVKGIVPAGYSVGVATGTNPITGGMALRYVVTHGAAAVAVCVTGTTRPATTMAFISPYGLAPC